MEVDLDQQLSEILNTNLRPDLVLWSTSQKELTVPTKKLKYTDIAFEAKQQGWRT